MFSWKKFFIVLSCVFIVSVLSGCAFSVFQKELNYTYSGPVLSDSAINPTKTLSVDKFEDLRDVTTPKMILHMYNGYGSKTTGGWEAEKPISDIVKDAIIQGIQLSGLMLANEGDFVLFGQILDFSGDYKVNMSLKDQYGCKLTVKFRMRDTKTKKIVWTDTFIGKATAKKVTHKGAHAEEGFKKALDNLLKQLFEDEYFLQQFI